MRISLQTYDNFFWQPCQGTLTISQVSDGTVHVNEAYTFPAKTSQEATEEYNQVVRGQFPTEKQAEKTYYTRDPKTWVGVSPVNKGLYKVLYTAQDKTGNVQGLEFTFEVVDVTNSRRILGSDFKDTR